MTTEPTLDTGGAIVPPVQWVDAEGSAINPGTWRDEETTVGWGAPPPPVARPARLRIRRWAALRRRLAPLVPHSLTVRLVAGVVALVIALVAVTGTSTYVALSSFLYDRLDQQVQTAAHANLTFMFGRNFTLPTPAPTTTHPSAASLAVLLDTSGAVLNLPNPNTADPLNLTATDRSRLAADTSHAITVRTTAGRSVRVISQQVELASGGQVVGTAIAVVGVPTDDVHRTLHRLLLLEWFIGAGAVVLAFGATSWGVQFSLRRLRSVTTTAREVAAELSPEGAGLDRRVEVHEPESEVGQLADSMNTLLAAVETQFAARLASEERMRQFLADASHELRTPLTSIRGYAELQRMQRRHGTPTEDNLARIEAEGTRMSRLVDDLLTLARSDQGADPLREPIELTDVADDAVAGVRVAYPDRLVEIDVPAPVTVLGDRDQLVRVVRNLATNAVVHTDPDGPVRVSVRAEGAWAVVRVADSGPGLAPDEAAHVFERFWRADKARTRASGGTGLGLAIVSAIVNRHGGTVRFDSAPTTGSTVTVALPRTTH
jgi:two-component system OmpR family sensor kinase